MKMGKLFFIYPKRKNLNKYTFFTMKLLTIIVPESLFNETLTENHIFLRIDARRDHV
jgi:hypothetical protein